MKEWDDIFNEIYPILPEEDNITQVEKDQLRREIRYNPDYQKKKNTHE